MDISLVMQKVKWENQPSALPQSEAAALVIIVLFTTVHRS